jgi:hypothetical protein
MGYEIATGPCFICQQLFTFNVELVPSYENQPICEECIIHANEIRAEAGRELWPVDPRAYEAREVP